jgi:hypothetical protein
MTDLLDHHVFVVEGICAVDKRRLYLGLGAALFGL